MTFPFNQDLSLGEEPIPLQSEWVFWYDLYKGPRQSASEYEPNFKELCSFKTVQEFWNYFKSLLPVKELPVKASYHLMRKGIKPIWEDPENARGGIWTVRINKNDSEETWRDIVLAVIGEQFVDVLDPDDDICGVTISIRKEDNILQVWNKKAEGNTQKILNKIQTLVPNIELKSPFYKRCVEHKSFDREYIKKKHSDLKEGNSTNLEGDSSTSLSNEPKNSDTSNTI